MLLVKCTFFICFRPAMKTGSSVVLVSIAVVDSLSLIIGLPDYFLSVGFGISLESKYKFICKSFRYAYAVPRYCGVYYLVIFTIFRLISVYIPHKNHVYCTRKRAIFVVILTSIVICFLNFDYLNIQYYPVFDESLTLSYFDCWFTGYRAHFYQYYIEYIALFARSLIPFTVIILANSMIIYKIYKLKALRQKMTLTANHNADDSHSMTTMLISISILFLVTQTPFLITNYIEKRMDYDTVSEEYEQKFYLLETVFRLLTFVNNVANFFCYCISGEKFRTELKAMVNEWMVIKSSSRQNNIRRSTLSTVTSTL